MGKFEKIIISPDEKHLYSSHPEDKKKREDEKRKLAETAINNQLNRREFFSLAKRYLKLGGTLYLVDQVAKRKGFAESIKKFIDYFKFNNDEGYIEEEKEEIPEKTPEMTKIEEEDTQAIESILDYDKEGDIKLDLEEIKKVENFWYLKYAKGGDQYYGLMTAYIEMGEWENKIKKYFEQYNVPVEYMYLAIPESHWNLNAVSSAEAVGPYQFLRRTGNDMGLFIDYRNNVDERKDPLKSGKACAKYLKKLHDKYDDWDIAVAAYNGGYADKYNKSENGEGQSYEKFLKFMKDKINSKRREIKNAKTPSDLQDICEESKISEVNQKIINNISRSRGMEAGRRILYEIAMKNYKENLVYPAKFRAVMNVINSDSLKFSERKPEISFDEKTINQREDTFEYYNVRIKTIGRKRKAEGLKEISRRFNITVNQLMADNRLNNTNLYINQKLKIRKKTKKITLRSLSNARYPLKKLLKLNPALKEESPIPSGGYAIRFNRN